MSAIFAEFPDVHQFHWLFPSIVFDLANQFTVCCCARSLSLVSVIVIQQIGVFLKVDWSHSQRGIAEKDLVVRRGSVEAWKKARKVFTFHPSQVAINLSCIQPPNLKHF